MFFGPRRQGQLLIPGVFFGWFPAQESLALHALQQGGRGGRAQPEFFFDVLLKDFFIRVVQQIMQDSPLSSAEWYDIVTRWERRRGRRVASGGFLVELSDNAVEIFEKKEHPLRKL